MGVYNSEQSLVSVHCQIPVIQTILKDEEPRTNYPAISYLNENNGKLLTLSGQITGVTIAVFCNQQQESLLKEHLDLSKKIINYVDERILFSTNYENRSKTYPQDFAGLHAIIHYVRSGETEEEMLARSIKYNVGNCAEMTRVGLQCPDTKNVTVERFQIYGGDHMFLVVGRDSNTDPSDPSTWNPDTVICDPWTKAYYPASEYKKFLMACIPTVDHQLSSEEETRRSSPVVAPLDLEKRHTIMLVRVPKKETYLEIPRPSLSHKLLNVIKQIRFTVAVKWSALSFTNSPAH